MLKIRGNGGGMRVNLDSDLCWPISTPVEGGDSLAKHHVTQIMVLLYTRAPED